MAVARFCKMRGLTKAGGLTIGGRTTFPTKSRPSSMHICTSRRSLRASAYGSMWAERSIPSGSTTSQLLAPLSFMALACLTSLSASSICVSCLASNSCGLKARRRRRGRRGRRHRSCCRCVSWLRRSSPRGWCGTLRGEVTLHGGATLLWRRTWSSWQGITSSLKLLSVTGTINVLLHVASATGTITVLLHVASVTSTLLVLFSVGLDVL